jgi:hypothetical protein
MMFTVIMNAFDSLVKRGSIATAGFDSNGGRVAGQKDSARTRAAVESQLNAWILVVCQVGLLGPQVAANTIGAYDPGTGFRE